MLINVKPKITEQLDKIRARKNCSYSQAIEILLKSSSKSDSELQVIAELADGFDDIKSKIGGLTEDKDLTNLLEKMRNLALSTASKEGEERKESIQKFEKFLKGLKVE